MSREEQIYAGPVEVNGDQYYAEVWVLDTNAVVFTVPEHIVSLSLHDIALALSNENRLILDGTDDQGTHFTVRAVAPEQVLGTLSSANVEWNDEPLWEGATVTWTQYRVTISLLGHDPRVFTGASVRAYPREAFIVFPDSQEVHVSLPARMTCCGGAR